MNNKGLYAVAAIASFVTALYMFRAVFMTFFGDVQGRRGRRPRGRGLALPRRSGAPARVELGDDGAAAHPDGGGDRRGLVGLGQGVPPLRGGGDVRRMRCTRRPTSATGSPSRRRSSRWRASGRRGPSTTAAWSPRRRSARSPSRSPCSSRTSSSWTTSTNGPSPCNVFQRGWNRLVELFDTTAVDGTVNGVGWVGTQSSRVLRHAQTGQVQLYGLGIAAGVSSSSPSSSSSRIRCRRVECC